MRPKIGTKMKAESVAGLNSTHHCNQVDISAFLYPKHPGLFLMAFFVQSSYETSGGMRRGALNGL